MIRLLVVLQIVFLVVWYIVPTIPATLILLPTTVLAGCILVWVWVCYCVVRATS